MAGKRRSAHEIYRNGGRVCSLCRATKPLKDFRPKGGTQSPRCRDCENTRQRKNPPPLVRRQVNDECPKFDDRALTSALGYPR